MTKTLEPGLRTESDHKPGSTASIDPQPTTRVKRTLIVGALLVALVAGGTPVADAATSKGDTSLQTKRICWFSRC